MKNAVAVLTVATFVLVVALPASAVVGASAGTTDGATGSGSVDRASAIVQLKGAPLSTDEKTKPAPGKKIDFSSTAVKSYRAQLAAFRNDFKQWLRDNAPKAKVTGEYDIAVNAVAVRLNGTPLSTIAAAPQVARASYQALYSPAATGPCGAGADSTTACDPDLTLVSAFSAWGGNNAGSAANAGAGVKVGLIDTGIDVTHPCFADGNPANDGPYTNDKVIVAKVFNNMTPRLHYTPEAVQDHGTHVAGTIACNYDTAASVTGAAIPYGISGIAPGAKLGNYNVFPGEDDDARSEDILNALEAAYADGMDIVNMSLGGGASGTKDLLTDAVDDLDQAGMISAVAAGNSGPGHFTIESPGSAARALTAGASTVGHFVGAPVTVGPNTYGAASGDFETVESDLTAPLGVLPGSTNGLGTACSALAANSLTGKIAVLSRGTCTFSTKIRNAEDAGAVGVLVVNNVAGDPVAMGTDGTADQPTIPAYMLGLANAAALVAANGQSATIGAAMQYFLTTNDDIMAGFSSQGPTDVDFRVKPDVVAPGVNVLSSIPSAFCDEPPCFAFFQGTSMATPHLAGSAAVVLSQHLSPRWSTAQIRSAIVNTADEGVLTKSSNGTTVEADTLVTGAGRENLEKAVGATVALDPVSVSFGAVPAGSGITKTKTIELSVLGGAGALAVSVDPATKTGGVLYSASLSGNAVTVTMTADKRATAGDHQAVLRVTQGATEVAHAVVYTLIK